MPEIFQDKDISAVYDETLDETPEFARDLLKRYTENFLYGCSNCGPGQLMEVRQARCKICQEGTKIGPQLSYSQ